MKYKIIDAISGRQLITYVNKLIKEGWKPIGGVSITCEHHGAMVYAQAMVTEDMSLKLPVERKFAID